MMKIAIESIGITGAFGTGVESFKSALAAGVSEPEWLPVNPDGDEYTYPGLKAKPEGLGDFVSLRALRRIDYFSRLAILGAGLAIREAGMWEYDRSRMGMVIGTGYGATATTFGFMNSMLEFGDACASPTKFSNSVHNAAGANTAVNLKLEGVNLTVSQFGMSVPSALISAVDWVASGAVDGLVFGGVDEYCRELGYCYKRYFGDHAGAMHPQAYDEQTAIPGEGAAFFMLRAADQAENPLATIENVEIGCVDDCQLPEDGTLFISADGHRESGKYYKQLVPSGRDVVCCSPVYGSLPAGPAFDMAAAILYLTDNPGTAHCLTCDCDGNYALISLTSA